MNLETNERTLQPEAQAGQAVSTKPNKGLISARLARNVGTAGLLFTMVAFSLLGEHYGVTKEAKKTAAAEAQGQREKEVSLLLGQAVFKNMVAIEVPKTGPTLATLSNDPNDPGACHIAFNLVNDNGQPTLKLPQFDARRHQYGEVVVTDNEAAQKIMPTLCN